MKTAETSAGNSNKKEKKCTKIIVLIQAIHVTEATMRNKEATVRGVDTQVNRVVVMKDYHNMIKIKGKTK